MDNRFLFYEAYTFGFQGQEKDDEIKGEGNSINYKYRMHDARLGRFLSLDPLAPQYAHNSPYAFSENSVIGYVELEGLERLPAPPGYQGYETDPELDKVDYEQIEREIEGTANHLFYEAIRTAEKVAVLSGEVAEWIISNGVFMWGENSEDGKDDNKEADEFTSPVDATYPDLDYTNTDGVEPDGSYKKDSETLYDITWSFKKEGVGRKEGEKERDTTYLRVPAKDTSGIKEDLSKKATNKVLSVKEVEQ